MSTAAGSQATGAGTAGKPDDEADADEVDGDSIDHSIWTKLAHGHEKTGLSLSAAIHSKSAQGVATAPMIGAYAIEQREQVSMFR